MAALVPAHTRGAPDARAFRHQIERAIEVALDVAHRLMDCLDDVDGDADFEPCTNREDDGSEEPAYAALVTGLSQIRWIGFEEGMAA